MNCIKIYAFFIAVIIMMPDSVSAQTELSQSIDSTESITIKVKGADCSNDLIRIAANVEKLDGVVSCKLIKEGITSKFEVIFKSELITKVDVYNAVENTGGCGNPDARPYTVKNK